MLLLLSISIVLLLYVLAVELLFYKFYYGITSLKEETTFFEFDLPIMAAMLIGSGAIGYVIGYKIVESSVKINGPNSRKDIYTLGLEEVLQKSEFLKH
jgi:hypothetical protein